MIQWIIVAAIIVGCVAYIGRRIFKRSKGDMCCNCGEVDCPARKAKNKKK